MKIFSHLDDVLVLAGLGSIVYSAFLIDQALGYFVAGVAGIAAVVLFAWLQKTDTNDKPKG